MRVLIVEDLVLLRDGLVRLLRDHEFDVVGQSPDADDFLRKAAAYFVVNECLANVAKYAEATYATVAAREQVGRLVIEVADDGRGGADPKAGSGLRGLADRVGALDGTLEVVSPAGAGTRVRAELPLAATSAGSA